MMYNGTLEGQRMKFGAKTIERLEASIFVTETTSWAVNICKNLIRDVSVPRNLLVVVELAHEMSFFPLCT